VDTVFSSCGAAACSEGLPCADSATTDETASSFLSTPLVAPFAVRSESVDSSSPSSGSDAAVYSDSSGLMVRLEAAGAAAVVGLTSAWLSKDSSVATKGSESEATAKIDPDRSSCEGSVVGAKRALTRSCPAVCSFPAAESCLFVASVGSVFAVAAESVTNQFQKGSSYLANH